MKQNQKKHTRKIQQNTQPLDELQHKPHTAQRDRRVVFPPTNLHVHSFLCEFLRGHGEKEREGGACVCFFTHQMNESCSSEPCAYEDGTQVHQLDGITVRDESYITPLKVKRITLTYRSVSHLLRPTHTRAGPFQPRRRSLGVNTQVISKSSEEED